MFTIYALYRHKSCILYVGKTTQPKVRHRAHKFLFGRTIRMVVLEQIPDPKAARQAELRWINTFVEQGHPLRNTAGVEREDRVKRQILQAKPKIHMTEWLKVRIARPEKRAFEQAARAADLSLSDWVRSELKAYCKQKGRLSE